MSLYEQNMLLTGIELGSIDDDTIYCQEQQRSCRKNALASHSLSQYLRARSMTSNKGRNNISCSSSNSISRTKSSLIPEDSLQNAEFIPPMVARKSLPLYTEMEYDTKNYDKIFASVWLSPTLIVMGTKCNKLLVLDITTGTKVEIPSLGFADESLLSPFQAINEEHIASAINKHLCYGIHSLAINPSRSLLAVGSGKPSEFIQIFCLPSFEPLAVLRGHEDMVFSVAWISDNQLISCSRDTTVKIWNIDLEHTTRTATLPNGSNIAVLRPNCSRSQHRGKVRDLKYNSKTHQAFSLSSDGFAKLWDISGCNVASSVLLKEPNEAVCMAVDYDNDLYAIGSQVHVSLIDPRSGSIVNIFESVDDGWGVRSMSIDRQVITIGGGMGRISFYDMRAQKYLEWPCLERKLPTPRRNSLAAAPHSIHAQTPTSTRSIPYPNHRTFSVRQGETRPSASFLKNGKGWLSREGNFDTLFNGVEIYNAVYTLGYESEGTSWGHCKYSETWNSRAGANKLFVAGGPLQLSVCGSYAAIWDV